MWPTRHMTLGLKSRFHNEAQSNQEVAYYFQNSVDTGLSSITFSSNNSGCMPWTKCRANINLSAWTGKRKRGKEVLIWERLMERITNYITALPWIGICTRIRKPKIAVSFSKLWSFDPWCWIPTRKQSVQVCERMYLHKDRLSVVSYCGR